MVNAVIPRACVDKRLDRTTTAGTLFVLGSFHSPAVAASTALLLLCCHVIVTQREHSSWGRSNTLATQVLRFDEIARTPAIVYRIISVAPVSTFVRWDPSHRQEACSLLDNGGRG